MVFGGLWESQAPSYSDFGLHFPRDGEAYIFTTRIDVRLQFPICDDLEELCKYYHISPMHLAPNTFRDVGWFLYHVRSPWLDIFPSHFSGGFIDWFWLPIITTMLNHPISRSDALEDGIETLISGTWMAFARLIVIISSCISFKNSGYHDASLAPQGCCPNFGELSGSVRNVIYDLYHCN